MKSSHIAAYIILSIIVLASFSCTIRYYDTNKLLNDYKTEGFLDRDHYQVIITGIPNKEAKGLVARRESALNEAKIMMNNKVINSLVNYSINYHSKKENIKNINEIHNLAEVKKILALEFQSFLSLGYTAFEYYNPDNSVVLVYRLFKDDLIDKIESIKPAINLKDPKDSKELKDNKDKKDKKPDEKKISGK